MSSPPAIPPTDSTLDEVVKGLSSPQKRLPTRLLYDEVGSALFEEITELPEYYPTRTETAILTANTAEIASYLGARPLLLEYGAGSSVKTRKLLDSIKTPGVFIPVDISAEFLAESSTVLKSRYPNWQVAPVNADFTDDFELPAVDFATERLVIFFSGSTIGNFERPQAINLLKKIAKRCQNGGYLLIGVDLIKDRNILHRAYNDSAGITAKFNLNILTHINRVLGSDFETAKFRHRAIFDEPKARIVMQLISTTAQSVNFGGRKFEIRADEIIITEYSHKYSVESFAELAGASGLRQVQVWTDEKNLFSLQLLTPQAE